MRSLTVLAAVLAHSFVSSVTAQTSAPDTAAIRHQIEANEQAVGLAIHNSDFDTLAKLWAPSMVVNSPGNSVLNREQVFNAMRHDELKYTFIKGHTESFTVSGDVAIEIGYEDVVMANGPAAGKPLIRRYTNVWQNSGSGGWVQIARQATYIGIDGKYLYNYHAARPEAGSK